MGCDIHAVFQARDGGLWVDVPHKFDEPRDYMLFGWLANVRNGSGFAGVNIGNAIGPIAMPRGLPPDFPVDGDMRHPLASADLLPEWRLRYQEAGEPLDVWLGDHNHSWLLGTEILAAAAGSVDAHGCAPQGVTERGYVDRDVYDAWDGRSAPSDWCGGIDGRGIVKVRAGRRARLDVGDATHVQIEWDTPLTARFHDFLQEVRRLVDLHGEVRMVFGFDS